MKKILGSVFFNLTLAFGAQAAVIEILPDANTLNIRDDISLNVSISNLYDAKSPSLGVYDITLHFNSDLFAVKSIQFGDKFKGNQLDLNNAGSLQTSDVGNNWINLFELSFDGPNDLNNSQAGEFTLFSILLTALNTGTGLFSLDVNSLGDAYGNNLAVESMKVTEINVSATVPEPTGFALIGLGLIGLGLTRTIRKIS